MQPGEAACLGPTNSTLLLLQLLTNELGDICGDVHLGRSLDSCSVCLNAPGGANL